MFKKFLKILFILTIAIVGFSAEAANCNFTRDLKENDKGEDVRCLQKYLNESGFEISPSGAGAKGKETNFYGTKTKDAVMIWQLTNGVYPAEGFFGAKSRTKYNSLVSATTTTPTTPTVTTPSNNNSSTSQASTIADLNSQISTLKQELVNAKNNTGFTGDQKKSS